MKKIIAIIVIGVTFLLSWFFIEKPNPPFGGGGGEDLLKYPAEVDTDIEKLEFSSRAEELLRLEHNVMGAKFRDGEITLAQWNRYLIEDFTPMSLKISGENARVRKVMGITSSPSLDQWRDTLESYKTSTKYQLNINEVTK